MCIVRAAAYLEREHQLSGGAREESAQQAWSSLSELQEGVPEAQLWLETRAELTSLETHRITPAAAAMRLHIASTHCLCTSSLDELCILSHC